MNAQGPKVKIYRTVALILCTVGFALYLLCYLLASDGSDYFVPGHPLPMAANAFAVASVLWCASALILIPKNALPTHDFTAGKPCIAAVLPVIGTIGAGVMGLTYLSPDELAALLTRKRPVDTVAICTLLVVLGVLLSIGYYVLRCINSPKHASASVVLGIGPVSLLTGLCGLTYFEQDHHMNAPAKIALQLAFIATMIFLTAELRCTLGKAQPRRYLASACVSLFANACALAGAVPALLDPTGTTHATRILGFALLCLCNGIYIVTRLIKFTAACNPPTIPEMPQESQEKEQQDGSQQQNPMASQEDN